MRDRNLQLFQTYQFHWLHYVELNRKASYQNIKCRVPQGSVLDSLLFYSR